MNGPVFMAPTHPCMGWASMNRYTQELRAQADGDPSVRFLLPPCAVEKSPAPRLMRLLQRRLLYPLRVRTQVTGGVLHLLDHSFAALLAHTRPGVRTVVTVHDLIPLSEPEGLSASQQARYAKDVAHLNKADILVCVSGHTRQEAHRLLGIPFDKMRVNPMGAAALPAPDAAMLGRLSALPAFILSVGHTGPRKNLMLLPELARQLSTGGRQPVIVRAGTRLDATLAAAIGQHAKLVELGRIQDAELAAAYQTAAVFFMPSRHEGFGLPVIEAMAAGCPVACARATSLPEVAGEAALFFDPDNATEAADACRRLLEDAALRQQRIEAGRLRARQFTYAAHWRRLREVYDDLLMPS